MQKKNTNINIIQFRFSAMDFFFKKIRDITTSNEVYFLEINHLTDKSDIFNWINERPRNKSL